MKITKRNVLLYLIGLLILSIGVSMIVSANLGAAPWDLLSVTLSNKFQLTIGVWAIIVQLVMLIITKIIFKGPLEVLSVIPAIIQGVFMDLFTPIIKGLAVSPYALLILGCFVSAIGISIYAFQGMSSNPIDNFTVSIHKNSNTSLGKAKVISDFLPLIIIMLLGTIPHFTTIVVYFLVPFFLDLISKVKLQVGKKYQLS